MKAIDIDLAPSSFARSVLRISPVIWLFAILGVVLCATASISLVNLQFERALRQTQIEQIHADLRKRETQKPIPIKVDIPELQANAVNAAIAKLNLPWMHVLNGFEASSSPAVALLTLEPDAKKHLLTGSAEAKSTKDMLAYLDRLRTQRFFDSVSLTKHEVRDYDKYKAIRFHFEVRWLEERE